MKKNLIIFGILAATLLTGCVDNVDIENYGETRKLVLYCRLCPQMDSTYILLSHSQLLFGQDSQETPVITDGTVELSADGSHWVQAKYDPLRQRYLLTREEFPVMEGGIYHIRASYPGFEDVSATCTVPLTHDVGFRFDTVATDGDIHWGEPYNWPHKDVYAEWRDVAGEENAYAIGYKHLSAVHIWNDEDEEEVVYEWRFDLDWLNEGNMDYLYVSDKGRDGQVMRFIHNVDLYDENEDDDRKAEEGQRYLFFLDRNCYQYEITLSTTDGMLSFLFLEPEHTYTNIDGGFGLFGAFSMLPVK